MYITLPNIRNGETVELPHVLDNCAGHLEIALCEILYYPQWMNIGPPLDNDIYFVRTTERKKIPPGYYNICTLHEEIFEPLGAELALNEANGIVKVTGGKTAMTLGKGLAKTLGFHKRFDLTTTPQLGYQLPSLVPHRELCVILDQISTTDNILLNKPSTVLRTVPVKDEKYNSGRTETFSSLQHKKLQTGSISNLKISVLDVKGQFIDIGYLSIVLHVKNG